MNKPNIAIILALITILLWSFLALMSSYLNHIPSLLSVGIALTVSGIISLYSIKKWKVPIITYCVGIFGIFGYHFLYFSAFHYAPAIEVSLMNYLWPLLIVVLSPLFLKGFSIKTHHIIGAMLGLSGAGLIVSGGYRFQFQSASIPGYLLAAIAALVWSSYSLMTKRLPQFPTHAVGGFCLGSGVLSLAIFFISQASLQTLFSLQSKDWLLLILLGLGPMGIAFFTWDAALKRGDPRIIGALSYLTPLLSTTWLILIGGSRITTTSIIAMILIICGAIIGSIELFFPDKTLTIS